MAIRVRWAGVTMGLAAMLASCTLYESAADFDDSGGAKCSSCAGEVWEPGSGADPRPWDQASFPPSGARDAGFGSDGGDIDRWKELLIVDDRVMTAGAAQNSGAGAWSFRHLVEEIAGPEHASAWVRSWLDAWNRDDFGVPKRGRLRDELVCPWLRANPANYCDSACKSCAEEVLPLGEAPFRLIAIVNRVDVANPEIPCSEDGGELRFIFVAHTPGNPARTIPFTAIFEYEVEVAPREGAAGWARRWHALKNEPFGPSYVTALANVTRAVTDHGARAGDRSALAQVRTNETAFGAPWEMREFAVDHDHGEAVAPRLLSGTPRLELDGSTILAEFIRDNRETIVMRGSNPLPLSLQAPSATIPQPRFRWSAPEVGDDAAVRAFSANTCNGCHGGERPEDSLPFVHVGVRAPYYTGDSSTAVSKYLHNPGYDDELSRRARVMAELLRISCVPVGGGDAGGTPYRRSNGAGRARRLATH